MLEGIRMRLKGVRKFSPAVKRFLKIPESVRFTPSDVSNLELMEDAYRILWRKRHVYALEIWKCGEEQYFVSSDRREGLEELLLRLSAVYPSPRMKISHVPLPEKECFVSAGFLRLEGTPYTLRSLSDFSHDPLLHAVTAAPEGTVIQFLFRPERIVAERPLVESPVYRLRIAVAVFSDDWRRAASSCDAVLRSFAVFSSPSSELVPVVPKIMDPGIILRNMLERRFVFPLRDSFRVTAEELAAIAHFPGDSSDTRHRRQAPADSP
ncbi:hypothetical protein [Archaeoglobus sp.]